MKSLQQFAAVCNWLNSEVTNLTDLIISFHWTNKRNPQIDAETIKDWFKKDFEDEKINAVINRFNTDEDIIIWWPNLLHVT